VVIEAGWLFRIGAITTLFVLWLGDQITRHGIGNGVVVLLIAGPILGLVSS
jgi:preprotein translocase subunit SecY